MKTIDDADVKDFVNDAEEDLWDATALARRPAGSTMAMYHAAQAAEKFLRGLGEAAGRHANPMWDLQHVYDAVKDQAGLAEVETAVEALLSHGTPGKGSGFGSSGEALRAARVIRRAVLVLLGVEVPLEPEFAPQAVTTAPAAEAVVSPREAALENGPPAGYVNAPPPGYDDGPTFPMGIPEGQPDGRSPQPDRRPSAPSGRPDEERRTSFVKMFLICDTCGVRLPRTRQTAQGRVPCPHCNRPMRLVS
jgi:HEPN domain-containing protein